MMAHFWKTKKFSKLNKIWQHKLYKSGFNDIEKEVGGDLVLKQNSKNSYRTRDRVCIESKIEFFNLIGKFVHDDQSMSERDRHIMIRFSEGIKHDEISKELKKGGLDSSRWTIIRTVTKYLTKWNIPTLKKRKIW